MDQTLQVVSILISLTVLVGTLELVRRGQLRSEYSLIWVASAFVLLLMALFRGSLQQVAELLGVGYGPSLLFMASLLCVVIIQIVQNIVLSGLSVKTRDLAQGQTIQDWHLERVEKAHAEARLQFAVHIAGLRLGAILEWDSLIDQLFASVMHLTGAESASLFLLDEERGDLYLAGATHLPLSVIAQTRLELGEGVAGWVAKHRQPQLLVGKIDAARFPGFLPKPDKIGSSISVPLTLAHATGQTCPLVGVLNVNRHPNTLDFTTDELALVTALAAHASIAIRNARQFQQMQANTELAQPAGGEPHILLEMKEGDLTHDGQTEATGHWAGRGNLRFAKTLGGRWEAAGPE